MEASEFVSALKRILPDDEYFVDAEDSVMIAGWTEQGGGDPEYGKEIATHQFIYGLLEVAGLVNASDDEIAYLAQVYADVLTAELKRRYPDRHLAVAIHGLDDPNHEVHVTFREVKPD
ncbi:MAG: hypothetical protein AAF823_15825 [Planctomycetota bacterium]